MSQGLLCACLHLAVYTLVMYKQLCINVRTEKIISELNIFFLRQCFLKWRLTSIYPSTGAQYHCT